MRWLNALLVALFATGTVSAQVPIEPSEDSVTIRLIDTEIQTAVQTLGRYLDLPLIIGPMDAVRVTVETPHPVPRAEVVSLLRTMVEVYGYEVREDSSAYSIVRRSELLAAPGQQTPGDLHLYVVRLTHARAEDVAATVSALYGRATALGELGGPVPLSQHLRNSQMAAVPDMTSVPHAVTNQTAILSGETTIIPEPNSNSLLVRATPADFELIRAAIEEVDIRPLQVLIEVLIVEARRDAETGIGLGASLDDRRFSRGGEEVVSADNEGLGLGDFVLRILDLGGGDLDLTLRAAARRGDVAILSRPVVLAANNERAEILVGAQRPFVQVQRTLPTEAPVRDQVVQYRDVGTQLSVRPTISGDGYIMLEVLQEVNAVTTETAFDAPVISTRSIQTRLLVRDGQTAVLGGLTDRQNDVTRSGVPLLSTIPIVGWLFGSRVSRTVETELFVFLTPRIIGSDDDLDDATDGARQQAERSGTSSVDLLPRVVPADTTLHIDSISPNRREL